MKPANKWLERGDEFCDKIFEQFLQQENFESFSFNNVIKAVFAQFFNRSLLNLMMKPMFIQTKEI